MLVGTGMNKPSKKNTIFNTRGYYCLQVYLISIHEFAKTFTYRRDMLQVLELDMYHLVLCWASSPEQRTLYRCVSVQLQSHSTEVK